MTTFDFTDYEGDRVRLSNGIVWVGPNGSQLTTKAAREMASQLVEWANSWDEWAAEAHELEQRSDELAARSEWADYLIETGRDYQ